MWHTVCDILYVYVTLTTFLSVGNFFKTFWWRYVRSKWHNTSKIPPFARFWVDPSEKTIVVWIRQSSCLLNLVIDTPLFDFSVRKMQQSKRKSINQASFPTYVQPTQKPRNIVKEKLVEYFWWIFWSINFIKWNWIC